jgi:hypothetical protein
MATSSTQASATLILQRFLSLRFSMFSQLILNRKTNKYNWYPKTQVLNSTVKTRRDTPSLPLNGGNAQIIG